MNAYVRSEVGQGWLAEVVVYRQSRKEKKVKKKEEYRFAARARKGPLVSVPWWRVGSVKSVKKQELMMGCQVKSQKKRIKGEPLLLVRHVHFTVQNSNYQLA